MNSVLIQAASFLPAGRRRHALLTAAAILVLLIVGLIGYRIYVYTVSERNDTASLAYWNLTQAIADGEIEQAVEEFELIRGLGADKQIVLAALPLAAGYYTSGQYEQSEQLYQQVIELAGMSVFRDVARIRLAKVQLVQNKLEDARNTLISVEQFYPQIGIILNSLLGDIALVENRLLSAQGSYLAALGEAQNVGLTSYGLLLEEKLDLVHSLLLQEQQ